MTYTNLVLTALCLAVAVVQAFSVNYDTSFFPEEFGGSGPGSASFTDGVEKRYGLSSACRSCMFRRDDWRSCTMCYRRAGHVPFYGGFSKRAAFPAGIASGDQESSPSGGELSFPFKHAASKRAASGTCRCCMASFDRECCRRCYYTPYYAAASKRSAYLESDKCKECCSEDHFDFFCCAYECAK